MAKTYSVSFPDPESFALEADAKKLGVSVPDLIRTRSRLGVAPDHGLSRSEIEHILREVTLTAFWARGEIKKSKDGEMYSDAIGKAARERLATVSEEGKRGRRS